MSSNEIKSRICFDSTTIFFGHQNCSDIRESSEYILLKEEINTCNTLTKFEIFTKKQKFLIYFNWSNSFTTDSFSFYFSETTNTLFLSTNEVIYTVVLSNQPIINNTYQYNFDIVVFHKFQRCNNYILALCEMEVVVFNLYGEFVTSTYAEPPYSIQSKDKDLVAINDLDQKEYFVCSM